jgi:hypothetical protein
MPTLADPLQKSSTAAPVRARAGTVTPGLASSPAVQRLEDTSRALNARSEVVAQRALGETLSTASTAHRAANRTGLPDALKAGVETLSGVSMDDVRVHRNSGQPAQLQAHAYARGTDIHLAPGQERHLPHEAWHVVQQKQRRVRPTARLAGGVPVNDQAGLESEATVMGARALAIRALAPAAPKPAAAPAAGGAPVQGVWVRQVSKYGGRLNEGEEGVYVAAKAGDEGAVDTSGMTLTERRRVRDDLAKKGGKLNSAAVDQLNEELNAIVTEVDEAEVMAIGGTLDALAAENAERGALSEDSRVLLEKTSFRLLHALDFLGEFDESDPSALRFRLLLQKYIDQLGAIDAGAMRAAVQHAESGADLDVSDEDVAAYRADIQERGVWGGGAEARAVAAAFNFRTRLLILDSQDRYVEVDTVGAGPLQARSLLNVGDHYQVVGNAAVAGQRHQPGHVLFEPLPDGDCLFSALFYVANGGADVPDVADPADVDHGAPAQLDRDAFIQRARAIASARLTRGEVENTIIELRLSGGRRGVGRRLAARMNVRGVRADGLRAALARTGRDDFELYEAIKAKLAGHKMWASRLAKIDTLSGALDLFQRVRGVVTAEMAPQDEAGEAGEGGEAGEAALERREAALRERAAAMENLSAFADAVLAVAAEHRPREEPLLETEGQSSELEKGLRRESVDQLRRSGAAIVPSGFARGQFIVTREGMDFVLDRLGQLVPRFVSRGISEFNAAELEAEGQMFPTGASPVDKGRYDENLKKKFREETAKAASGIGANKLDPSLEMLHVEGMKPSPFMSTTARASGAANPKGKGFGSNIFRIDLAYLPSSAIAATYTDRGMGYYLLSAYRGAAKDTLVRDARGFQDRQQKVVEERARNKKKKIADFTGEDAAAKNATLSGKEWQALMDVIRTEEILITAPIPRAAMSQPEGGEKEEKAEE